MKIGQLTPKDAKSLGRGWAKPSPNHTLDRIDIHNKRYEPGNVRWADKRTQTVNRSNTVPVNYLGRTMTIAEFCEITGLSYSTVWSALQRSENPEQIAVRAAHKASRTTDGKAPSSFRHPDPEKDGLFQEEFRAWKSRLRPDFKLGHADIFLYLLAKLR